MAGRIGITIGLGCTVLLVAVWNEAFAFTSQVTGTGIGETVLFVSLQDHHALKEMR